MTEATESDACGLKENPLDKLLGCLKSFNDALEREPPLQVCGSFICPDPPDMTANGEVFYIKRNTSEETK